MARAVCSSSTKTRPRRTDAKCLVLSSDFHGGPSPPFNEYFRLPPNGYSRGHIGKAQNVCLNRSMQFMSGLFPTRACFAKDTGTQFAYAIFKTTRGHSGMMGSGYTHHDG